MLLSINTPSHYGHILSTLGELKHNMGNNFCREIGIGTVPELTGEQVRECWDRYDMNHNGVLEHRETTQFIKDFSEALKVPYKKEIVDELFKDKKTLNFNDFLALFKQVAGDKKLSPDVESGHILEKLKLVTSKDKSDEGLVYAALVARDSKSHLKILQEEWKKLMEHEVKKNVLELDDNLWKHKFSNIGFWNGETVEIFKIKPWSWRYSKSLRTNIDFVKLDKRLVWNTDNKKKDKKKYTKSFMAAWKGTEAAHKLMHLDMDNPRKSVEEGVLKSLMSKKRFLKNSYSTGRVLPMKNSGEWLSFVYSFLLLARVKKKS